MSDIVVDASAMAAWLLDSQATPAANALSAEWDGHNGFAPHLFAIELRAVLLRAERREGGGREATGARWRIAPEFRVALEEPLSVGELDDVMELARRAGSSFKDAHYLDLAVRLSAAVASRDRGMLECARRLRLDVLDLRLPTAQ